MEDGDLTLYKLSPRISMVKSQVSKSSALMSLMPEGGLGHGAGKRKAY